jgi:NADH-quinone oxidoreductase subunit H
MNTHDLIAALVKIGLVIGGLMTAAAYFVLLERWVAAWVQDRRGPNRVGIPLTNIRVFGLGQPLADGVKFVFKEEFTPGHVDKLLFWAAPIAIFVSALVVFAVIPFGHMLPPIGSGEPIPLVIAPGIDVGMVYVFAVSSIAVYGVILGSWASNNKYSFLGGLRSGAQLISYEIPLGLGLLGVVLMSGSLRLDQIILNQAQSGVWNVLAQPVGFVVFVVAAFAEAERLPFDLPEAEQELVGGYHTEYSGLKLLMYLVAEFVHMFTAAFLIVILFLGGWHFWGLPSGDAVSWPVAILRVAVLLGKVVGVILFFMLARWSWPRFRFDQLMNIAWKVMIPWGLVNLVVVAFWMEYGAWLAAVSGIPAGLLLAAIGWGTLFLCWLVVSWADPTATNNRPVRLTGWREHGQPIFAGEEVAMHLGPGHEVRPDEAHRQEPYNPLDRPS